MANRFGVSRFSSLLSLPAASGGHYGIPNPADISAVTLWLDAAVNVTQSGGAVSQWNSRKGSASFVQATSANQPEFLSSQVNGLPAIRFNGATKHMSSSFLASSTITAAAYSMFVVGKITGGLLGQNIWEGPAFITDSGSNFGMHPYVEAANAPTIRTGDTNSSSASNVVSYTINKPSSADLRNGDYIVIGQSCDLSGGSFTGLETFTAQPSASGDSGNHRLDVYTRLVDFREPASWQIAISASEQYATRAFAVEGAGSIDFSTADINTSNRTSASVSGTVTNNDSLAVVFCSSESGATNTIAAPDGTWTQLGGANLVAGTGVAGETLAVFWKIMPAGATGTLTFTQTALEEFLVSMIVFTPKQNAVVGAYSYDGTVDASYVNIDSSTWGLFMGRHTGGNLAAKVNGLSISQNVASGNTSIPASTMSLGSAAANYAASHDVAEIIVANAALSQADENGIMYYLNQKYALF